MAILDGDSEIACRLLTPERRAELTRQFRRRSCDRAITLQGQTIPARELDRLGGSKVTKVAVDGNRGTAEVTAPAKKGSVAPQHTVMVRKLGGEWKVASNFFPGALLGGTIPKPPPGPPPNPAEERKVAAVFARFAAALRDGDGKTACGLRTRAAQASAVSQAIELEGGTRRAARRYGALTCQRVSVGVQVPDEKVRKVVIDGAKARLTLLRGATYGFRKIDGRWKIDS